MKTNTSFSPQQYLTKALVFQNSALLLLLLAGSNGSAQSYRILHSFVDSDGAAPMSLMLSGTTLYGTTTSGGSSGNGTVFRINTDGSGYTVLKDFAGGTDGSWPWGQLALSGTTLYGTAVGNGSPASNFGLVFKVSTDGSGYTVLKSFNDNDGNSPMAGLLLSGATLYGTTCYGGSETYGSVFKLNTDGSGFAVLRDFVIIGAEPWAAWPYGGLSLSSETLFGTTTQGGSSGNGSVFKINTDRSGYTVLKSFTGHDGQMPNTTLVLSGTTLFGTTLQGGAYGCGTIFKVNTNGSGYMTLKSFAYQSSDGCFPRCPLVLSGTVLYGMTGGGGGDDHGTAFQIGTDGADFKVLKHFTGSDGGFPYGSLVVCGTTLYGTTYYGGSSDNGVVFALGYPPTISADPQSQTAETGSAVCLRVLVEASPNQYQWFFNHTRVLNAYTNVFILTNVEPSQAGNYEVVVTNIFGAVTSLPAALSVIPPVPRRPVPGINVKGEIGNAVNIDYADLLSSAPNWAPFGSVSLTSTSQYYFDLTQPLPPQRFFRAWQTGAANVMPPLDLHIVPAITVTGNIGDSVRVDCINQFGPIDAWVTLATVTLTNTSRLYFDVSAPGQPERLYRLVPSP